MSVSSGLVYLARSFGRVALPAGSGMVAGVI